MSIFRQTTRFLLWTTSLFILTSCFDDKIEVVSPAIIPMPLSQQINEGRFQLDNNTSLTFDKDFSQVADFAKSYIENGSSIKINNEDSSNKIEFIKDSNIKNEEAYSLSINSNSITIKAVSPKGAFYGFQSLRQLLPASFENGTFEGNTVLIQNIDILFLQVSTN